MEDWRKDKTFTAKDFQLVSTEVAEEMLGAVPPVAETFKSVCFQVGEPYTHSEEGLPMYTSFIYDKHRKLNKHIGIMTVKDFKRLVPAELYFMDFWEITENVECHVCFDREMCDQIRNECPLVDFPSYKEYDWDKL